MVQFKRGRKSPWMVQVRDLNGGLKTKSFRLKTDAEDFERKEARNKQLFKAGLEAPKDGILFIDYTRVWLTKRSNGKQSTFRPDESKLRKYWIEKFGIYPLQSMTTALIKEHLDYIQFELGRSPATRNRHRALLHTIFEDALLEDKVVHNPVSRIPLIKEVIRRKSGVLEPKDQANYIQAIYGEGAHYGIMADIMLWTGVRIMGAAALQWQDIDFEKGIVRLRRIIERVTNSPQERTKGSGEGGEEIVPLLPILRDRLLIHHKGSPFIRPTDYIAAIPDKGSYVPYESYMGAHNRVIQKLGVTRFTPHALKKAFATNAKRAGLTRAEIREMFGHSSEQITARYDLKDVSHLVEKAKALKFGSSSVSSLSTKEDENERTGSGS